MLKKNLPTVMLKDELLNMFFFISEAMRIAVSFSKFHCLYVMFLLWDNSKHVFSVALILQSNHLLAVYKETTLENWVA